MSDDTLAQLVQIKWLLVVFVAIALVNTGLRVVAEMRRSGGVTRLLRVSFADNAHRLLDEGRYAELRTLAASRFDEAPGDGLAYWYHAMAAYREGDVSAALGSMQKVAHLQPDWRESHVAPFMRALRPGE